MARLIGAPPGYVGYEEGGYLTEAVRRKPYSVVLLDEVEKAHPDVFNVLLQVLDDGRLTDGQGRTVDFRNTVIVMTSNLGSHHIQSLAGKPYEVVKEVVWDELKQTLRPEFLNRIDEVVVFHGLEAQHIESIARIQLRRLGERLERQEMRLEVTEAALAELARSGFDPVFGARPLKRAIQQQIENPVARLILKASSVRATWCRWTGRTASSSSRAPCSKRGRAAGACRALTRPRWLKPEPPGFTRLACEAGPLRARVLARVLDAPARPTRRPRSPAAGPSSAGPASAAPAAPRLCRAACPRHAAGR